MLTGSEGKADKRFANDGESHLNQGSRRRGLATKSVFHIIVPQSLSLLPFFFAWNCSLLKKAPFFWRHTQHTKSIGEGFSPLFRIGILFFLSIHRENTFPDAGFLYEENRCPCPLKYSCPLPKICVSPEKKCTTSKYFFPAAKCKKKPFFPLFVCLHL